MAGEPVDIMTNMIVMTVLMARMVKIVLLAMTVISSDEIIESNILSINWCASLRKGCWCRCFTTLSHI